MKQLTILVIEEHADQGITMKRLLERRGYTVILVVTAETGFDEFTKNPSDVVITDSNKGTPGMDGEEMAEKIKQISPTTKIVMLTGWDIDSSPFLNMVLHKPISTDQFEKLLGFIAQPNS